MKQINSKIWIVVAASVVCAGGISLANARNGGTYAAPDNANPVAGVADATKLSDEDTLARARMMTSQMAATEARIGGLQKRAQAKKDMVMVNCASDKLTQVRGYAAVGAAAMSGIEAAIQSHDSVTRSHNFDRQTIVYQKVLVLGTEAEGCIGEDVNYVGATRVDIEIDPSIPPDDPTIPTILVPTAERPPDGNCPNS
jgi:hypothetical protein